jgi:hypothetical protein
MVIVNLDLVLPGLLIVQCFFLGGVRFPESSRLDPQQDVSPRVHTSSQDPGK